MPLLYAPSTAAQRSLGRGPADMREPASFVLWGDDVTAHVVPGLLRDAVATTATIVGADGKLHDVAAQRLPLLATALQLSALRSDELERVSASAVGWVLASKFALELVARQALVPTLAWRDGGLDARWAASLAAVDEMQKAATIASTMAPSGYAIPDPHAAATPRSWQPVALLRDFLDATVDAIVRTVNGGPRLPSRPPRVPSKRLRAKAQVVTEPQAWPHRLRDALASHDAGFGVTGFADRNVPDEMARWSEPAKGAHDRLRACFRLEIADGDTASDGTGRRLPTVSKAPFVLRFLLQAPDDPSLLVTALEVWQARGDRLTQFGKEFHNPHEALLEALGRAARLFAPIGAALALATPTEVQLDPAAAWTFFAEGAAALSAAGFAVMLPAALTASGQRRMRARMRISGGGRSAAGVVDGGGTSLHMDEMFDVDWEAALGDETLTPAELAALARQKAPLVQHRGAWIIVDPLELAALQARVAAGPRKVTAQEALRLALAAADATSATTDASAAPAPQVSVHGSAATLIEQLRTAADQVVAVPSGLRATLRPYQLRGLAWLRTLANLGLGGCLADDMGLGKTVQLLALMLALREPAQPASSPAKRKRSGPNAAIAKPILLIVPTSVVGNWQAEAARFAPDLTVVPHYGPGRCGSATALQTLQQQRGPLLLLTTYGMVRRDIEWLADVDFALIVLDEAQNIKNANSAIAEAVRRLRAPRRFALTGTPVENRLAELWSILDFANPGLLGPLAQFRHDFALPIERHGNQEVAARLRRMIAPFVLRRLKSDPAIISDLPGKLENKVACSLTREQASLYQAVVDEEMRRIEAADGMARRGRVLALLSFLKQICNHPAQYLGEARAAAAQTEVTGRSGKLDRLVAMLDEALASGDKALVFTQFHEMGELLTSHIARTLGIEVLFLHGATSQTARTQMVQRFQDPAPRSPRVFVLSVKAGGTGLNLTAANHVFHFDRWWNPAVEDQATDRAYRIGQRKVVAVHKLVCAGTIEDKIDAMLRDKKALADRVVGAGEQWITELSSTELRSLFALAPDVVQSAANSTDDDSPSDNGSQGGATSRATRTARARRVAGRAG